MESVTYFKNLKITPKKLRFLLPAIKKLSPNKALVKLLYTPKKPAKVLYQAIKSAMTNAKNNLHVNDDLLTFKTLSVDEGNRLKRFRPGGRGTAKPYKKKFSHVKIVLFAEEKKLKVMSKKSGTKS
jgi:large subunit ribosomal protein L22